ncbi:MAG: imelysin family protein [Alphaproteobacteria bacterium]|nr:imelysin family protein [Alphaproteobacteria bacterium]MBU0798209.1 imelysin family protein [Alphaproteobacteria bacterium]MBU0887573.1 imelysin family protein [Alphaproteobacteria bacterium]MBU1814224.1 imelysin family protein [Alphaproteobacteria bacterium]MBU2090010.1 imelysin family protein [Alphaproteobacteria bacterium]
MIRKTALVLAFLLASPEAWATDYAALNKALVETQVIPRYQALEQATGALRQSADAFCAAPDAAGYAALTESFHGAVDGWQSVQHIRFGPVELFMRSMRLAFWPDPRNSAGKQLSELLASRDESQITQDAFQSSGVAVQGFPALERVLFEEEALAKFTAKSADSAFRCKLVTAISRNLADMAKDIREDWTKPDGYAHTVAIAGTPGTHYQEPKEATLDLFKSLYGTVEIVADHKIARPMGASLDKARPRLAESWRSARSMRNVVLNLEAGQALYLGGFSAAVAASDKKLDDLFRRAFTQTIATANSVSLPLEQAVEDKSARARLQQLVKESGAMKQLFTQRLTAVLDIPAGFNAMDGD